MSEHPMSGLCNLGWSTELKPWGLTVSLWLNPDEYDFEKMQAKNEHAFGYYYKHVSGATHVAWSREEQLTVHQLYGVELERQDILCFKVGDGLAGNREGQE